MKEPHVLKKILIKLGSQCNWHCPHCHSEHVNYPFNPKVLDWVKANGFEKVCFGGGEPTLYWKTIEKICRSLGHDYHYQFVTNGSLMDQSKRNLIDDYDMTVCLSYDGSAGMRSNDPPPRYEEFCNIRNLSFSICVYKQNMDFARLERDFKELCEKYHIQGRESLSPEFVHQTEVVPGDDADLETAKSYCVQIAKIIELELVRLKFCPDYFAQRQMFGISNTLKRALWKWWVTHNTKKGIRCFNENIKSVSLSGKFLLCPYTARYDIGTIETGPNWEAIEALVPPKCRNCPIFNVCRCSCVANVTDNECYIARTMNRWLNKVVDKYELKETLLTLIGDTTW